MKRLLPMLLIVLFSGNAMAATSQDLYDNAKSCYQKLQGEEKPKAAKWEKCITAFKKVSEQFPESHVADKSLYSAARLGRELYVQTKNTENAEEAIHLYNAVVKNYPRSPLADDALYQIGLLRHDPLQDNDRAKKAFEALLERYPKSDSAPKARTALKNLAAGSTLAGGQVVTEATEETSEGEEVAAQKDKAKKASDDNAFKIAKLSDLNVDAGQDITTVTLVFDKQVTFTKKFVDFGNRTKSPAQLTLNFIRSKASKALPMKKEPSSAYLSSIHLKNGVFSGELVVRFELGKGVDYTVSQSKEKVIIKFFPQGQKPTGNVSKETAGIENLRIVIDPGHGGKDKGAIGPRGVQEKVVTLEISKKLAEALKKNGAKVFLTRTADKNLSLEDRNAFVVFKKADIFISVHTNAVKDKKVAGIETYYLNNATDEASRRLAERENRAASKPRGEVDKILSTLLQNYNTEQSRLLASDVHTKVVKGLSKNYPKVVDRKLKSALFYVLVGAKCPGILLEASYLSNPLEEKRLTNANYQKRIASAIAEGVKSYIKKEANI